MSVLDPSPRRDLFVVEETMPQAGRPRTRAEVRAKFGLTLAMWGSSFAIFTLGSLLSGSSTPLASGGVRALLSLFGAGLCYGLHLLLSRLAHRPFRTRAIIAAATAPFVAEVYAWINYFAFAALHGGALRFIVRDWGDAMFALSLWTWFFIAWTGLYLAIEYSFEARHEAERAAELRSAAQAAKLRALSNQINPHFLFNSLNSISALILDGKSAEAEQMLGRLSTYFRSTLAIDPLVDVTLEREFELHRRYLAIEQMRYPDLTVAFELPEALRAAMVPALIVQPLVENAIKHGVARSRPPTRIEIAASARDATLTIAVVNIGAREQPIEMTRSEGIGVANVRQRLAEYFGTAQSLELRRAPDRFEAIVTMPLRFQP